MVGVRPRHPFRARVNRTRVKDFVRIPVSSPLRFSDHAGQDRLGPSRSLAATGKEHSQWDQRALEQTQCQPRHRPIYLAILSYLRRSPSRRGESACQPPVDQDVCHQVPRTADTPSPHVRGPRHSRSRRTDIPQGHLPFHWADKHLRSSQEARLDAINLCIAHHEGDKSRSTLVLPKRSGR